MTPRRWLEWTPKTGPMEDVPEREPTKPSKQGFAGFESAASGRFPNVADPAQAHIDRACTLAESAGTKPTKPSQAGSVGFEGATSSNSQKIGAQVGAQKFEANAQGEPTIPSKPGFVGFDGDTPAESPEFGVAPDPAELAQASGVLGRMGVRLMELDGVPTAGIWSDLDGPDARAALKIMGWGGVPVCYLDGAEIPMRYKMRAVDGQPVPQRVLKAMERQPDEPWKVRDRMLKELTDGARNLSRR